MKKIKKIGVLRGGYSAERDVSLRSGYNVEQALLRLGYEVQGVDPACESIPDDLDLAYIALHGTGGEDGAIQGYMQWKKIPYTGSGVTASAIAFNKIVTKQILQHAGLATADFKVILKPADLKQISRFPVILKPALEGSSIGVTLNHSAAELEKNYQAIKDLYADLLVEDFLVGREITVSLVGRELFPVLELLPKHEFYDYEAKYTKGLTEFILPANLSPDSQQMVETLALNTVELIGTRGPVRVDMIVTEDGQPWVLEVNTSPGMTETSDLPAQAAAAGLGLDQLVQKIVEASVAF